MTFLENWAVIYLMVIFLGGVMELLRSSATGMTFFWIQAVIAALVLSVVTWYLGRRKQFGNQLFLVTLVHRGHAMEIMGYWDSGNQLRDPYDHRPVCILSRHSGCKDLKSEKGQGTFYPLLFPGTEGGASAGDRDHMHKNSEWKARSRDKTGNGWNCK